MITDINLAKDIKINIITKLFRHESFEDTLVLDSSWLHSNLFATLSEINYSTHLNSAITNNKNNEDDCDNNENDTEPSNIEVLTKEIKEHAYSADHGIWALKKTADNILASTSYQWLQIAILGLIAGSFSNAIFILNPALSYSPPQEFRSFKHANSLIQCCS